MKRWSDRNLALALLGALAAAAAAPARAGDLGGRIILSWQSYTSGDLETEGLHQLYDLRLGRALTDSLRLRFTFRGEDDGSGSTLLGERRTRDTRQVQPGFRLLYSVGSLQLQGDWDRLQTDYSSRDGQDGARAESRRTQDWLRARLTFRPEDLPGLTIEGTRRRGSDPSSALDLTETRSTVRLDYAWHGLQAAAIHQTLDFEDVAAGYDRRSRALQGNLGYSGSFWDDRFAVQANAYTSRGRIDVRALGGGATEVPNPVGVRVAAQAIDDTPEDGRDHPLISNPLLTDGDLVHAAGAPLGPDASSFLNLAFDFGRFAQVDELRIVARDPSGNPVLTGGSVSWDLYASDDQVLWQPVTSGVTSTFDSAQGYWSVRFPRRTTRYLKVVSFFVNTVPTEITEVLAFFNTQLVPGSALAGDQTLTSGSGILTLRPVRSFTVTWSALLNNSDLAPDLSAESSTRDRDQRLSALWEPVRWGNLEVQRQWRRATSVIGAETLDQDLDAWTGIARLTPGRNLNATLQYDHTEEDLAGGQVSTDRLFLHTLARFWETLELNLDVGRTSQDDLGRGLLARIADRRRHGARPPDDDPAVDRHRERAGEPPERHGARGHRPPLARRPLVERAVLAAERPARPRRPPGPGHRRRPVRNAPELSGAVAALPVRRAAPGRELRSGPRPGAGPAFPAPDPDPELDPEPAHDPQLQLLASVELARLHERRHRDLLRRADDDPVALPREATIAMRETVRTLSALALVVGLAAGCATTRTTEYTHPAADLGAIKTVAVLPFTTLTQDRTDAEKVQKLFLVELLAKNVVEVVEPGRVAQLVASEHIESTDKLAPEELQRIGKELGADGIFLGTVIDFAQSRTGNTSAPDVTLQLRLVEVASGTTAWSSTESRSGANVRARLFGFGGDSLTQAARSLIRDQLRSLVK